MVAQHILHQAVQRLAERFNPTKIILFGSQARGAADEHSDVDLLVSCPLHGHRRDLMVAMDRALKGLGIARDIIVLTPEEFERDRRIPGTVARPVARKGVILYDRTTKESEVDGQGKGC